MPLPSLTSKLFYLATAILLFFAFWLGYLSRPYLQFLLFTKKAGPIISTQQSGLPDREGILKENKMVQEGTATISSLDKNSRTIIVDIVNLFYAGQPKQAEEAARQRKLIAKESLSVIAKKEQPLSIQERTDPLKIPKVITEKKSFDDLKEGMAISFIASEEFNSSGREAISVEKIIYVVVE